MAVYATGFGLTTPVMTDGAVAATPLPQINAPVRVLVGGVGAPLLFGFLIASGSRNHVGLGYLLGGLLMLAGAVCEYFIGVEAAGKSLESISAPLQSASEISIARSPRKLKTMTPSPDLTAPTGTSPSTIVNAGRTWSLIPGTSSR